MATAPILKWAGGKRQLLPQLLASQPPRWQRYYEPFAGGAALFFALALPGAYLGDANTEVIHLYRTLVDDTEGVIDALAGYANTPETYLTVRATDPTTLDAVQRAARFLYLNKTCFNGLYRENRRGQFNVPFGRYAHPNIINADGLRAARPLLQTATLAHASYTALDGVVQPDDWVYCDPPYVPVSATARFTAYTAGGFSWGDQEQLAATLRHWADQGVFVMTTNAAVPALLALYPGFWHRIVPSRRAINRVGSGRTGAQEVILTSYPVPGAAQLGS